MAHCIFCNLLEGEKRNKYVKEKKGNSVFPEASCRQMDLSIIIMMNETWICSKYTQPILYYFGMTEKKGKKKKKTPNHG